MSNPEPGTEEGATCNRKGCQGIIELSKVENCSCHIRPPCGACANQHDLCPECGWSSADECTTTLNDYTVVVDGKTGVFKSFTLRELDKTKVDWHSHHHTHFSMIKRGVYPDGTTMDEVRKLVDGTFGGRFNYFSDGKFEFVAYTD